MMCRLFISLSFVFAFSSYAVVYSQGQGWTGPTGRKQWPCLYLFMCLRTVWGRAGRKRGSCAQQIVLSLGVLKWFHYGCGCTLWPTVTANWILTVTDKCFSGTRRQSLSSLFHLAWTFIGIERVRFSNCIPRDVELLFGDSGGISCLRSVFFVYLHAPNLESEISFGCIKRNAAWHLYIQCIHNAQKNALSSSIDITLC